MDEQLQQIFHLRPLQDTVIIYRSRVPLYRKVMKKTCQSELNNLIKVEMEIVAPELKIPDSKKVPTVNDQIISSEMEALLEEFEATMQALDLL